MTARKQWEETISADDNLSYRTLTLDSCKEVVP